MDEKIEIPLSYIYETNDWVQGQLMHRVYSMDLHKTFVMGITESGLLEIGLLDDAAK